MSNYFDHLLFIVRVTTQMKRSLLHMVSKRAVFSVLRYIRRYNVARMIYLQLSPTYSYHYSYSLARSPFVWLFICQSQTLLTFQLISAATSECLTVSDDYVIRRTTGRTLIRYVTVCACVHVCVCVSVCVCARSNHEHAQRLLAADMGVQRRRDCHVDQVSRTAQGKTSC